MFDDNPLSRWVEVMPGSDAVAKEHSGFGSFQDVRKDPLRPPLSRVDEGALGARRRRDLASAYSQAFDEHGLPSESGMSQQGDLALPAT